MNNKKHIIDAINRSAKDFGKLKTAVIEEIESDSMNADIDNVMLERVIELLESRNLLYADKPSSPISIDCLSNETPVKLFVQPEFDKVVFQVKYPFSVRYSMMPLVSTYLLIINEVSVAKMNLDFRQGGLTVDCEYVFGAPNLFSEKDFWFFMKSVVDFAAKNQQQIWLLSIGIIPENEKEYCRHIFQAALDTINGKKQDGDFEFGLISTLLSMYERYDPLPSEDLGMFEPTE